jgi:hypothetical protein
MRTAITLARRRAVACTIGFPLAHTSGHAEAAAFASSAPMVVSFIITAPGRTLQQARDEWTRKGVQLDERPLVVFVEPNAVSKVSSVMKHVESFLIRVKTANV